MTVLGERDLRPPLLVDGFLVATVFTLVSLSIVMVYSTTAILSQEKFGDPFFYVKRQSAAALAGFALLFLFSRIDVARLRNVSLVFLPVALVLLIAAMLPGVGDRAGGAQRWINLGIVRFQPGEFTKLMFVIFMAGYFARKERTLGTFMDGVFKPLLLVGAVGVLYLVQPDFGSTVIVATVVLCMAAVSGVRLIYIAGGGAFAAAGLATLVVISPYRLSRVLSFLSPMSDTSGKGYQLIQSLIAIGSGRVTGVGLGESKQKLFYLPAAHTDFIFSMIAEELGFIGASVLIALFLVFLWRGVRVAARVAGDTFSFALAVGLTMLIVLPALLNVGVVTGILPTKGLVLPLVGYGGSSLIASLAGVGLLLAVERSFQKGS